MKIEPALTAEEWANVIRSKEDFPGVRYDACEGETPKERHYTATINLYNQPFGFKHWMVEWLTDGDINGVPGELRGGICVAGDIDAYIAAIIEALLPPEEK